MEGCSDFIAELGDVLMSLRITEPLRYPNIVFGFKQLCRSHLFRRFAFPYIVFLGCFVQAFAHGLKVKKGFSVVFIGLFFVLLQAYNMKQRCVMCCFNPQFVVGFGRRTCCMLGCCVCML